MPLEIDRFVNMVARMASEHVHMLVARRYVSQMSDDDYTQPEGLAPTLHLQRLPPTVLQQVLVVAHRNCHGKGEIARAPLALLCFQILHVNFVEGQRGNARRHGSSTIRNNTLNCTSLAKEAEVDSV